VWRSFYGMRIRTSEETPAPAEAERV